jgi:hypothetical protein
LRHLAHIRVLGYTPRTWNAPTYHTPGVSQSHSVYDVAELEHDDFADDSQIRAGMFTQRDRLPVKELTANREPRISAQFSSLAQARSWQGGWQVNWSTHYLMRPQIAETRTLTQNNNRNAYGRAEQQRATIYNPWPSAGALYPKAV